MLVVTWVTLALVERGFSSFDLVYAKSCRSYSRAGGAAQLCDMFKPFFAIVWLSDAAFVYETLYGGAAEAPIGRGAARTSTLIQALSLGKKLVASRPQLTFNVYKFTGTTTQLVGTFPKRVNAEGAIVRFRRRAPRLGGADDARLGVAGMGDDVWRELMEGMRSSVDDAWTQFRKELELGREIEVVDEEGNPLIVGDYLPEPGPDEYD